MGRVLITRLCDRETISLPSPVIPQNLWKLLGERLLTAAHRFRDSPPIERPPFDPQQRLIKSACVRRGPPATTAKFFPPQMDLSSGGGVSSSSPSSVFDRCDNFRSSCWPISTVHPPPPCKVSSSPSSPPPSFPRPATTTVKSQRVNAQSQMLLLWSCVAEEPRGGEKVVRLVTSS